MIENNNSNSNSNSNSNNNSNSNRNNILLQDGYEFLIKQCSGALHARLVNTIVNLGICDILDDGKARSCQELSKLLNVPDQGMHKLLRYFTFHKIFIEDKSNGTFSNSNYGKFFTKQNQLFGVVKMFSSDLYYELFKSVPDSFTQDHSGVPKSMGVSDIWDVLDSDSNKILFKNAMQSATEAFADEILTNVDFSSSHTIVDIGGSHGLLIQKIVDKYQHIHGINFDLDKVISTNPQSTNPRLQHVSGSFFDSVPPADTYILKQIIHDWSDEDSIKIINTISRSMKPGGKLYIFDYIIDESNYQGDVLFFDMKMYHLFHAKERSEGEFKHLLDKCGFKIDKIFNKRGLVASKKE